MSLRQTPRGYKILQRRMLRARRRRKIPQWRISRTMRARSVLKKYPPQISNTQKILPADFTYSKILQKYSRRFHTFRKYSKNSPNIVKTYPKIFQRYSSAICEIKKYSKDTPVPSAKIQNTPKILQSHLRNFKVLQRCSSAVCGFS